MKLLEGVTNSSRSYVAAPASPPSWSSARKSCCRVCGLANLPWLMLLCRRGACIGERQVYKNFCDMLTWLAPLSASLSKINAVL